MLFHLNIFSFKLENTRWYFIQMAKRKADFTGSLDGFVTDYFKKTKCERTSKLFQDKNGASNESENVYERFIKYLKRKQTENVNDDLGFEINFGAYKPKVKVSWTSLYSNRFTKSFLAANIER